MRTLIVMIFVSLANTPMAYTKDLSACRPEGAKCDDITGKFMSCVEQRCDPPVHGEQTCHVIVSTIYTEDGECRIMHRIVTISRPIEPPNKSGSGVPDAHVHN